MNNTYITRMDGYMGLMAAIVEQARHDAKVAKTDAERMDAEMGIAEWAEIAAADINFKIYE